MIETKSFCFCFGDRIVAWLAVANAILCNQHTFQMTPRLPSRCCLPAAEILNRGRRRDFPELLLHAVR